MADTLLFLGETESPIDATIWKSDGTKTGTKPLFNTANVNANVGYLSYPGPILLYANGHVYTYASELLLVWDAQNTNPTPFNAPGNNSQVLNPYGFTFYDGASGPLVYFGGDYWSNGQAGNQLMSTDGTQAGTTPIDASNLTGSSSVLSPSSLTVAFDRLFFSGFNGTDNVLCAYNGSGQPVQVADVVNPAFLTFSISGPEVAVEFPTPHLEPGPSLFMSGQDSGGGPTWLYRYDGTTLTKIAPTTADQSTGLQPYDLCGLVWSEAEPSHPGSSYQSAVFFSGMTAAGHHGLWMSEGATGTTTKIVVPSPATDDPYPFNLTAFNGNLYFTANDTHGGRGLFVYDPVGKKASEIIDSRTLNFDSGFSTTLLNQTTMTVFNEDLYCQGWTGTGAESVANLWRANLYSEGTAASPTPVYIQSANALNPCSLTTGDL
jgi:hypothetical protein